MFELDLIEILGIKILAMYHTGILEILPDEIIDEIDLAAFVPPDNRADFDYSLTGNPLDYISANIISFVDKYYYIKEFKHTMPTFEFANVRFYMAYKLFNNMLSICENIKREQVAAKQQRS